MSLRTHHWTLNRQSTTEPPAAAADGSAKPPDGSPGTTCCLRRLGSDQSARRGTLPSWDAPAALGGRAAPAPPRHEPICSCRQPPVSALPLALAGGEFGEADRVELGILAEKLVPSANNKKSESFPECVHVLIQEAPGNQIPVISFTYSNLIHLLELGVSPLLVIYKYSQKPACPLCAPSKMAVCKYFCRSNSSSNRDSPPMKACGVDPPLIETTVGTLPELPEDILMGVFATLEIPDLIRAGSVCPSWRSTYTSLCNLGKYKQSQTPCLLYTSESAGDSVACLYSLVEKRVYKLTLPEPPVRSRFLIGSSLGLLVTVDERSEMHLVNPITGEQIALPSVITIEQVKPIYNDSGAVHKYEYSWHTGKQVLHPPSIFALGELRECFHFKAFVFSDTSTGSYIVVLIHRPRSQLSFARVGDDKWTWLPPHTAYNDCTYKDGLLYAVTLMGEIHAFDLSGPAVTVKIIMEMVEDLDIEGIYIVQAPWGGLLLVWRSKDYEDHDIDADRATLVLNTTAIKIHEVDAAAKKLVEINCLHDHVLFLGHNQPLCLSTEEYPALKANHAYFTDDGEFISGYKNNRRDIGVLDLDNNSREDFVSPQLWSNWPAPVWITPNLTTMKRTLNK